MKHLTETWVDTILGASSDWRLTRIWAFTNQAAIFFFHWIGIFISALLNGGNLSFYADDDASSSTLITGLFYPHTTTFKDSSHPWPSHDLHPFWCPWPRWMLTLTLGGCSLVAMVVGDLWSMTLTFTLLTFDLLRPLTSPSCQPRLLSRQIWLVDFLDCFTKHFV